MMEFEQNTPWRRVYAAFKPRNQFEFARMLNVDRSKISRVMSDDKGLINGRDQEMILIVAGQLSVKIDPVIMVPSVDGVDA